MQQTPTLTETPQPRRRVVRLAQLGALYPHAGFTESSVRWMRFHDTNGFNRCVRKIGRLVLVDLDDFEDWLDSRTEAA